MNVTINGTNRQVAPARNLSDLVNAFCPQPRHVMVELNGVIVPSHQWPQTSLKDGDTLELVAFVGGG